MIVFPVGQAKLMYEAPFSVSGRKADLQSRSYETPMLPMVVKAISFLKGVASASLKAAPLPLMTMAGTERTKHTKKMNMKYLLIHLEK